MKKKNKYPTADDQTGQVGFVKKILPTAKPELVENYLSQSAWCDFSQFCLFRSRNEQP